MARDDKALVWLHGEIHTPPFTREGRVQAGVLLRRLQRGAVLSLPHARPMPSVFKKQARRTPDVVVAACRRRLGNYDVSGGG